MNTSKVSVMLNAYCEAALWASTDVDGTSLDTLCLENGDIAGVDNIAENALQKAREDCESFFDAACTALARNPESFSEKEMVHMGHDFFLTRNHHGAGFWDSDNWCALDGKALTIIAHRFGEVNPYFENDQFFDIA